MPVDDVLRHRLERRPLDVEHVADLVHQQAHRPVVAPDDHVHRRAARGVAGLSPRRRRTSIAVTIWPRRLMSPSMTPWRLAAPASSPGIAGPPARRKTSTPNSEAVHDERGELPVAALDGLAR